jgi:hypothetical protein
MKIKKALLSLILLLVAGLLAAQEGISVYEGARFSYRVDFHDGNQYAWQVFSQLGQPVEAVPGEFTFTGAPDWSETEIQWDLAGTYYLVVTETNPLGCFTSRTLPVQVLPNNRSIGFDAVASNECFTPGGNGFELPVSLLANNGEPLPENHYPVNVTFTVNGVAYQQVLEYGTRRCKLQKRCFRPIMRRKRRCWWKLPAPPTAIALKSSPATKTVRTRVPFLPSRKLNLHSS